MLSESLKQAETCFHHGSYKEAVSLYEEILGGQLAAKKFDHLKAVKCALNSNIATCHLRDNKSSLALEKALICERLVPMSPKSFFLQGMCHRHDQKYEKAIRAFVLAVKCSPLFIDGGSGGLEQDTYVISDEKKFTLRCLQDAAILCNMETELKSQLLEGDMELELLLCIPVLLKDGASIDMLLDISLSDCDSYHFTNRKLLPLLELREKVLEKLLKDMFCDAVCCSLKSGSCHQLQYFIHLLELMDSNSTYSQGTLDPSPIDLVCTSYQKGSAQKTSRTSATTPSLQSVVVTYPQSEEVSLPSSEAAPSPLSQGVLDRSFVINLLLSAGWMERNKEHFEEVWSNLSKECPVLAYFHNWLESDEAIKMRDLQIMRTDQVTQYLLSLLCSQLRGKVPVVLPHLTVLSDCQKAEVLSIKGNNVAWKSLVQCCVSNHGLGLLQLSVVLEQLGCPNLGDSVYRVYKRLFLRPSHMLRKSVVVDQLHINFSRIAKHLTEHESILPVLLGSIEDVAKTGRFYEIFLVKQGQVSRRQGQMSSVVDFLGFMEYGCFEEPIISAILKEVGCSLGPTVKHPQPDCCQDMRENHLKLWEESPWPEIESVNINEIVAVMAPSKKQGRRRRTSSKRHVRELHQPEELKNYEVELVDQVCCRSAGMTQVYMPCVASQPAIASAIIQKHIWHFAEKEEDSEGATGGDGTPLTDIKTEKRTAVLIVVPCKKAVSNAVCDLNKYLPHLKIGDHGVSAEHKKGKGKGVVHKTGLAKALQSKDIIVCAEETFNNCINSASIGFQLVSLIVYLNLDTFTRGLPLSITSHPEAIRKSSLPLVVLLSKSILQSKIINNTVSVQRHLEDLFEECFPEVKFHSHTLMSGEGSHDVSDEDQESWELLCNASSQCYGSMGYLTALLMYESHNYNEEKVQLKIEESVTNILPASLMVTRIQDIADILKTKRKGCNFYWMKYTSLNMHICQENLSAEVNFLFFKKKCHAYAIAGTNLKNVLQMLLYSVGA